MGAIGDIIKRAASDEVRLEEDSLQNKIDELDKILDSLLEQMKSVANMDYDTGGIDLSDKNGNGFETELDNVSKKIAKNV